MRKILKHLSAKQWSMIAVATLFIGLSVYCDLQIPGYMSEITILIQGGEGSVMDVLLVGGQMLAYALGGLLASFIVCYIVANVATAFSGRLRKLTFDKTLSFSLEEIGRFSTASLITRTTNDINQIQMLIMLGLRAIIRAPIMAVMAIAKIAGTQWQWTAAMLVAIVGIVALLVIVLVFAVPRFKIIQKQTDDLNRITREGISGIRVVRAYNAEEYQEEKFRKTNEALTSNNLFVNRVMALMQPGMSMIMAGLSLAIYWIGAIVINATGIMERLPLFSDMVVFSSYAMQIVLAFILLVVVFVLFPRASVSAKRINEVLDTDPSIRDGVTKKATQDKKGEVEFRNVSFRYPGNEDVLRNISFTAKQGETVAIIGATGSGKSSLVNLIPRFYDVNDGMVLVDGVDVREYPVSALREKLGYVSQKAFLFSGTVSENVAYGEDGHGAKSEEDIEYAVEVAQATDFVERHEFTYSAPVAQGGTNFSGGQKQRLSIARAIAKKPEIYIFDDSFSALDYATERNLRNALRKEAANSTCIIVAQRIGSIQDADKIIVLEDGGIIGIGKHTELMESCDVYREIALSQLSKEEMNVG